MPDPQAPIASPLSRRAVWMLVLGVTLARVLYLVFLCPVELTGDEAQYWDWSRRLDLSYYSKGPGVAWTIAAATKLFGDSEWAVRLPAALAAGVAALALAALARRASGGDGRVAFLAAAAFCLIPAYQAAALLMTIDGPYIACWIVACLAAWRAAETDQPASQRTRWRCALAAALGAGFLFKYTILLLIPGLALFKLCTRRSALSTPPRPLASRWLARLAPLALFLLLISPVLLWNARHGWPTVSHLLGHAGAAGGDRPDLAAKAWSYDPRWTLEFLGAQIGLVGPAIALMALGVARGLARGADPALRRASVFALASSGPILLFYLALTIAFEGEANWPIAGYGALIIPAAMAVARDLDRRREMMAAWLADPARPKRGLLRRKPETIGQVLWHWSIGYGLVAGLGMMFIVHAAHLPVVGRFIPLHRFSGWRELGAAVGEEAARLRDESPGGAEPFIMARRYDGAARLAFYTPGRPRVLSAASFMGDRRSSYDFFPDTDPRDPALLGRPAILAGANAGAWREAFRFEFVTPLSPAGARSTPLFVGVGYGGPASGPASPPDKAP